VPPNSFAQFPGEDISDPAVSKGIPVTVVLERDGERPFFPLPNHDLKHLDAARIESIGAQLRSLGVRDPQQELGTIGTNLAMESPEQGGGQPVRGFIVVRLGVCDSG
jgi:hypothetical protein